MKIDEDVGVDDEGGGEVDGATHARPDVVGEKAPHLVAKGQVFGAERDPLHVSEGMAPAEIRGSGCV